MSFDTWLDEMISRAKTVEKQCGTKGASPKVMEMLLDRSIEPYGLWKGTETTHMSIPPEEMKAALEAVKKKYKLKEDEGELILIEYVDKARFSEIAGVLKNFGYAYNKGEKAFIKGGQ